MGTSEGIFRYVESAEQAALERAFAEIFDFVGTLRTLKIEGATRGFQANPTPRDDGGLSFDEIVTGLPQSVLQKGGGMTVVANNEQVVLEEAPADALFAIRTTEEEEIASPSDLERLRDELSEVGPLIGQLPKTQWYAVEEARLFARVKLVAFEKLFEDQSRGTLTGQAFTARLKSL